MTRNLEFDVPSSDGVGTAVDTSDLSLTKTIGVEGPFTGVVVIEASAGGGFCQIASFTGPVNRTIEVVATQMRVRVQGLVSGTPVVTMSAEQTRIASASVAVPAGDGTGASTDITALSENTTVVVDGNFTGVLYLEYSSDNTNFEQAGRSFTRPGCYNLKIPASYVRVVRANTTVAGSVQVFIAAEGSGAGSGGYASNVDVQWGSEIAGTLNFKTIYVRTTGNDVTGDGSLTNPYLTFERAWEDIPAFTGDTFYNIDITDMGNITLANDNVFGWYSQPTIASKPELALASNVGITPSYQFPSNVVCPIMVTAVPTVLETIEQADISGTVADAIGLITIQTTLALTPGALVGKQIYNASGAPSGYSVVVGNTATDIQIAAIAGSFDTTDGTLRVTEPSARFQTSLRLFDLNAVFQNIGFDVNVQFKPKNSFYMFGCDFTDSVLLGETRSANLVGGCSFSDNFFALGGQDDEAGAFWQNNFFNGCGTVGLPDHLRLFYTVFNACGTISKEMDNGGTDLPLACTQYIERCRIINGTSHGWRVFGQQVVRLNICDFDGNAGNGILVDDKGFAEVFSTISTNPNGTHGVQMNNGGVVQANGSTTVSGASGDYKCGGNAAVAGGGAGWGALANETDLAAGAPELCRVFI